MRVGRIAIAVGFFVQGCGGAIALHDTSEPNGTPDAASDAASEHVASSDSGSLLLQLPEADDAPSTTMQPEHEVEPGVCPDVPPYKGDAGEPRCGPEIYKKVVCEEGATCAGGTCSPRCVCVDGHWCCGYALAC
jgi:hypothetical protein